MFSAEAGMRTELTSIKTPFQDLKTYIFVSLCMSMCVWVPVQGRKGYQILRVVVACGFELFGVGTPTEV